MKRLALLLVLGGCAAAPHRSGPARPTLTPPGYCTRTLAAVECWAPPGPTPHAAPLADGPQYMPS